MIYLRVVSLEVTTEGAKVTFLLGESIPTEVILPIPKYDVGIWAQAVGSNVPLDPQVLANQDLVLLEDHGKNGRRIGRAEG